MGAFLSMTGIASAGSRSRNEIVKLLQEFAAARKGRMFPDEERNDSSTLVISGGDGTPATILYPWLFLAWEDATRFLSASLGVPAIFLHIHDEDLWMYMLYSGGELIDQFNPLPDYWREIPAEERAAWKGDARIFAAYWPGVSQSSIERYLVPWDFNHPRGVKAYPDDEYEVRDCWQLRDFMRKLGVAYPLDEQGNRLGDRYFFEVPRA